MGIVDNPAPRFGEPPANATLHVISHGSGGRIGAP